MDQNTTPDIEAWRRVHRQLTLALIQSRDNIAAELTKRRYLLEEMNRCKMQNNPTKTMPGGSGSGSGGGSGASKTKKKTPPNKKVVPKKGPASVAPNKRPSTSSSPVMPPKTNISSGGGGGGGVATKKAVPARSIPPPAKTAASMSVLYPRPGVPKSAATKMVPITTAPRPATAQQPTTAATATTTGLTSQQMSQIYDYPPNAYTTAATTTNNAAATPHGFNPTPINPASSNSAPGSSSAALPQPAMGLAMKMAQQLQMQPNDVVATSLAGDTGGVGSGDNAAVLEAKGEMPPTEDV